jgi:hypothetical protein
MISVMTWRMEPSAVSTGVQSTGMADKSALYFTNKAW